MERGKIHAEPFNLVPFIFSLNDMACVYVLVCIEVCGFYFLVIHSMSLCLLSVKYLHVCGSVTLHACVYKIHESPSACELWIFRLISLCLQRVAEHRRWILFVRECACKCVLHARVLFSVTFDVGSCLRGAAEPQEVRACWEAEGGGQQKSLRVFFIFFSPSLCSSLHPSSLFPSFPCCLSSA